MLRPTQSAIIFVQQLGRGLRKADNKEYLTVIDFIGNYSNSFLVPIALYGDTTYNKDTLRKLMSSGSSFIPGSSTINFDKIAKELIFNAINSSNMQKKRDLINDYNLLKSRIGRTPMMIDFIENGSRDPFLYVEYSKSYFNFVNTQEIELSDKLNVSERKLLELFSFEINNSKRVEESILLRELIKSNSVTLEHFEEILLKEFNIKIDKLTINSIVRNLNFEFPTENHNKKLVSISEKYGIKNVEYYGNHFSLHKDFLNHLKNQTFKYFLIDSINYSIKSFEKNYNKSQYYGGFILYNKYSRKDVFRILNWNSNPLAQNVGGYIVNKELNASPLFVTYKKEDNISSTTKYHDHFINNDEFEMMSKSKRNLNSPEIKIWMNDNGKMRIPLFIKKNNDEGTEFYYMGDVTPIKDSFELSSIPDDFGKPVSVVKIRFSIKTPVEDSIYSYITS